MNSRVAFVLFVLTSSSAYAQDFQVGARAKAMGGSYTAFDDDPTSIWMNPAGIAPQGRMASIAYQTYTQYEPDFDELDDVGRAEVGFIHPAMLPSFLGLVFPLGTPESPIAFGFAYVRPVHVKMLYDAVPGNGVILADRNVEQQFSRFRLALAHDIRFRAVGEAGVLPRIAIGASLDLGYTDYVDQGSAGNGIHDSKTGAGAGFGLLVGLYDDTESLRINVGFSYQSKIHFSFQDSSAGQPAWEWPSVLSAGMSVYLLQGMPLRFTVDVQWVDWRRAIPESEVAGFEGVRDGSSFSMGFEYRLKLNEDGTLLFYPRVGFRHVEALWGDNEFGEQPVVGASQLLIKTDGTEFNVGTFGFGIAWTTGDGKARAVDVGFEAGGDTWNLAFGYTHEW
jgi:long-subunit fatty acid transport protein